MSIELDEKQLDSLNGGLRGGVEGSAVDIAIYSSTYSSGTTDCDGTVVCRVCIIKPWGC